MDMLVAVVGVIGSIIVALLARMAGLTWDDRARAGILRDAELWSALPDSPARADLAQHMEEATRGLLSRRQVDLTSHKLVGAALGFLFAAWVLWLVFSTFQLQPYQEPAYWYRQVATAVYMLSVSAGLCAIIFSMVALLVVALRARGPVRAGWGWLMTAISRRRP